MLDKSIPYYNVIMKRRADVLLTQFALPQGYSFEWYVPGKEEKWAEIETSVTEFENTAQALAYFRAEYLPFRDELVERLLFISNQDGEENGTIMCWWNMTGDRRDPSIHWFAVKDEYQGLGLGKALLSECLSRLLLLEGNKDIYLHTSTQSYKAVGLYLKAGFEILEVESFGSYNNDYDKAMAFLPKNAFNLEGNARSLYIEKMNECMATEVLSWKYDEPYDFYNNELSPDAIQEMLDNQYYAVMDAVRGLVGFFCIGNSAQVPNNIYHYSKDFIDIGIGLNPELTGKGFGTRFLSFVLEYMNKTCEHTRYRLTVAKFNQRAIKLYGKFGFSREDEFKKGVTTFITMIKEV